MLCALTVRKLKPGTYEQFRKAWQPDTWPEGFTKAYHLRNVEDPNEIVSFGYFFGSLEDLEKAQADGTYDTLRKRTAAFEESISLDAVYEILEEVNPSR